MGVLSFLSHYPLDLAPEILQQAAGRFVVIGQYLFAFVAVVPGDLPCGVTLPHIISLHWVV